jgi:uncharacterized protein YpuA (DUF1002 family)
MDDDVEDDVEEEYELKLTESQAETILATMLIL